MKKILFLLIILTSCSAPDECPEIFFNDIDRISTLSSGDLYTGRCLTFENGSKRSVQQYLNGKDYGKLIFYFPDGSVETKGRFNKAGQRVGKWKYYYETGQSKQVSRYSRNGERIGKWIYYNNEGEITNEVNY